MTRPLYYTYLESPVGDLLLLGDDQKVRGLYFRNYKHVPLPQPDWIKDRDRFRDVIRQLAEYFAGERRDFDVPIEVQGTDFQQSVRREITKIAYNQRISYADIARAIGKPAAVRAVGTAVGSNPLCIIVPCHRVLASNGGLGGYAGGLDAKKYLLALEGAN